MEAKIDAMYVTDLEENDLIVTPVSQDALPPQYPRDVSIELPSGVNKFGMNSQAISSKVAADLRNQLEA